MTHSISMLDAAAMIKSHYGKRRPLMLLGKPGMGKTSLFEKTCQTMEIGFIDFRLTLRDPVDVGGIRIPDAKTGKLRWFCPDDLPDEKKHGPDGIMLFDEINVVSQLMQATAYGIIQERRIGSWTMPGGWVAMASGNNVADRAAAQRMSTALANRFNVQCVEPDLTSWLEQYALEHVDHRGVAFLRFRPALFHVMPGETIGIAGQTAFSVGKDETAFPSARSWTNAFQFIDEAPAMRRKIFSGYVGPAAADEFEAFWRVYSNMISIDDIISDPKAARVPSGAQPDVQYAVAGMLGNLMTAKTSGPIFTYLARLPEEYQVIVAQSATKRDPSLKVAKGYTEWAVRNQHVLI
jgi:hypothetical protein